MPKLSRHAAFGNIEPPSPECASRFAVRTFNSTQHTPRILNIELVDRDGQHHRTPKYKHQRSVYYDAVQEIRGSITHLPLHHLQYKT